MTACRSRHEGADCPHAKAPDAGTSSARNWRPHAKGPSPFHLKSVFFALLYLTEKYGRVFPSLEGLAHLAMCCKQSVVTAIADLELLGFVSRIRRIRQITTPLGFTTRQITNGYRVHEPTNGLGLLATLVFATESNCWAPSAHIVESEERKRWLDPENPLHKALARLGRALGSKKGAAADAAAKGYSM
jgi:hypothetical protein